MEPHKAEAKEISYFAEEKEIKDRIQQFKKSDVDPYSEEDSQLEVQIRAV